MKAVLAKNITRSESDVAEANCLRGQIAVTEDLIGLAKEFKDFKDSHK